MPLQAAIEPRLRTLVSDAIGVEPTMLTAETSLADDLAMDSLDLLDVVVNAESDLTIVYPEREVAGMRTYGDLVTLTTALVARSLRAQRQRRQSRVELRVRPNGAEVPSFLRVVDDVPYDREVLAADLRAARSSDLVEVSAADPSATFVGPSPARRRQGTRMGADLERAVDPYLRAGTRASGRPEIAAGSPA